MNIHTIGSDFILHIFEYLDCLSCARFSTTCKFIRCTLQTHDEFLLTRRLKILSNNLPSNITNSCQPQEIEKLIKELASFLKRRRPNSPFFEIIKSLERSKICLSWFGQGARSLFSWQIEVTCLILKTNGTPLYISKEMEMGNSTTLRFCSSLLWFCVPDIKIAFVQGTKAAHAREKEKISTFIKYINTYGAGKLYLIPCLPYSSSTIGTIVNQKTIECNQFIPAHDFQFELILVENVGSLDPWCLFNTILTKENEDKIRAISAYSGNLKLIDNTWCHLSGFDALTRRPVYSPGFGNYTKELVFHDSEPLECSVHGLVRFVYTTKPIDEKTRSMITTGSDLHPNEKYPSALNPISCVII